MLFSLVSNFQFDLIFEFFLREIDTLEPQRNLFLSSLTSLISIALQLFRIIFWGIPSPLCLKNWVKIEKKAISKSKYLVEIVKLDVFYTE